MWIDIQGAWFRLIRNKQLKHLGWRVATGPIAATIRTLRQIGWEPTTASAWRTKYPDLEGDTVFAVLASCADAGACSEKDKREILNAIRKDLIDQHWVKASKHYLGGGLEKGQPSFIPAKDVHAKLLKKGEYLQASMLEKVVAGTTTHDGRGSFKLQCHR